MYSNDLINFDKELMLEKTKDKRFKINFSNTFILCIVIIIINETMKYLEHTPELFHNADYLFHTIQSILDIIYQFAISISSGIIFYYIVELINEKKKLNTFKDIRKYSLFILYKHMNMLINIDYFKNLNKNQQNLNNLLFLIQDVPILLECYNKKLDVNLKLQLNNYFINVQEKDEKLSSLSNIISSKKYINSIKEHINLPFYKGFREDIEELENIFEDFESYADIYIDLNNKNSINEFNIDILVNSYLSFLSKSI